MQVSILNTTILHKRLFRLDSEYYSPQYIDSHEKVHNHKCKPLGELCYVTDGEHGTIKTSSRCYSKYFGARNVLEGILDNKRVEYISKDDHFRNKRSILQSYDVLISCVGANIGYASIVPDDIGVANIVRNVALVRSVDDAVNNSYLLAFFLSKYGKNSFIRIASGNAQPLVSLDNIKEIAIPVLGKSFQKKIEEYVNKALFRRKQSMIVYSQAGEMLLNEMGLGDWQAVHKLNFIKNFSNTTQADRMDAEYFQPKYDHIIKAVKKYKGGWDVLGNLVKITKSIEPGGGEYKEKGVKFLRVSNLSKLGLDNSNPVYLSEKFYQKNKQHQPKQGEILLSKDATLGIAYNLNETPEEMIVSSGILRLKLKDERINEDYLALALNSVIVQEQAERDAGGSIIKHWRPDQIKNVIIPLLDMPIQTRIQQKIRQSFEARRKSKELLELAKRAVEMAIEKDEKAAMKWIEEQGNLGE